MEELYCGIDLGTSSVKIVATNSDFQILYSINKPYSFNDKKENQGVLDPDLVYEITIKSLVDLIKKLNKNKYYLKFISFSSALHSLILVDESFKPLSGCLTWADNRAAEFKSQLLDFYKSEEIYKKTGCPAHAIYLPAKILWFKKYRPDLITASTSFITIKEYIIKKLTLESVVDYSLASGGGLLNIHDLTWEKSLLSYLDIKEEQLSSLIDGKTVLNLNNQAIKILGADIPVVIGSGDGPLANLGAGSFSKNDYVITIGSSGAVRKFSEQPVFDSTASTWCYLLDKDLYLAGGAINNGGLVLNWIKESLFDDRRSDKEFFKVLESALKEVPLGSNGLNFLPYLSGERSPNWEDSMRGILFGLDLNHGQKEILKATVEGIVFRLYSVYEATSQILDKTDRIIATGGFTNSENWLQIVADIFGQRISSYRKIEASALGAVMLGAVATDSYENYSQINYPYNVEIEKDPVADNHLKYEKIFETQKKIYNNSLDVFKLEGY